jgi:hypothetical protein
MKWKDDFYLLMPRATLCISISINILPNLKEIDVAYQKPLPEEIR